MHITLYPATWPPRWQTHPTIQSATPYRVKHYNRARKNRAYRANPSTLYGARRFVIECSVPSTIIFLAMKNSIIFISALSLVTMMLSSCGSVFAPDETATTGVTSQTNEKPPERSADTGTISAGHY